VACSDGDEREKGQVNPDKKERRNGPMEPGEPSRMRKEEAGDATDDVIHGIAGLRKETKKKTCLRTTGSRKRETRKKRRF